MNPSHLPEYASEALGLGLFMLSACGFAVLLEHPSARLRGCLPAASLRRLSMGLAMGLTAIAIVYSPLGARSGAHINPAVTLAFLRLGRIETRDALFYIASQSIGAVLGMLAARALFGSKLSHASVNHVVTVPGARGTRVAFLAELASSSLMMLAVLSFACSVRLAPWTGVVAGGLVAVFLFVAAPLSGMSMNPARSLGSALSAREFRGLWLYFLAPPMGMLAAAEVFTRCATPAFVCAKLNHAEDVPCIFCATKERIEP